MLYRTLANTSANLNGLNLGTRSNATVGVLNGDLTLRLRPTHPQHLRSHSMREGMSSILGYPPFVGEPIATIPGFSLGSSRTRLSGSSRSWRSEFAVVAEASPVVAEVVLDGRAWQTDRSPKPDVDQPQDKQRDQVNGPRQAQAWSRATSAVVPPSLSAETPTLAFASLAPCRRAALG
jgi:hypothetical protein